MFPLEEILKDKKYTWFLFLQNGTYNGWWGNPCTIDDVKKHSVYKKYEDNLFYCRESIPSHVLNKESLSSLVFDSMCRDQQS